MESSLYNMAYAHSIDGLINPGRFQSAWANLTNSAPVLKTTVKVQNGVAVQCFDAQIDDLKIIDLSRSNDSVEESKRWMTLRLGNVFNLEKCLIDAALLKLSESRWIFFCNQHHLITDAWSSQLIWGMLTARYFSDEALPEQELKESQENYPYTDYLAVESRKVLEADNAHWQNRQSPAPIVLYGLEKTSEHTDAIRIDNDLNRDQVITLEHLANLKTARSINPQISKYHVLLAVYVVYLSRVSGQQQLTLFTPVLNRDNHAWRNTPGLFTELVPLNFKLSDDNTLDAVIGMVREELSLCLKNAGAGVSSVVSQPGSTAVFNYINAQPADFGEFKATAKWLHNGHMDSHHVMRLHVCENHRASGTSLLFEFSGSRFSTDQSERAIDHWWQVFNALADDPQCLIGEIDFCGSAEQVISGTGPVVSGVNNVPELVQAAIAKYPDQIAVADNNTKILYREFGAIVSQFETQLLRHRINEGDRVAVYLNRSIQLPALLLAILNCGAVYVPIDAATPPARVENILHQCRASLVVVDENTGSKLSVTRAAVELNDLLRPSKQSAEHADSRELNKSVSSTQLAYIMFTSGSTGEPKGVMVSHGALANYIQWAADFYSKDRQLSFPLYTSIGFDLTVTSLFVPLVTGGTMQVYKDSADKVDLLLFDVIKDNLVDIVKLTPAHLTLLQGIDLSASKIKQLIVGGDDLKHQLASNIQSQFPHEISIHNEYGPTEATVGCVVHTFNQAANKQQSVPIGLPVAGMHARIVNSSLRSQPAGLAGELLLSGPSLADGYWQQKAASKERFIVDSATGQVTYRTGDLVRLLHTGQMIYLGRIDNQVKINGYRVELGEIESACLRIEEVDECVARLITHESVHQERQGNVVEHCSVCGLSTEYHSTRLNSSGVCQLCERFEKYRHRATEYFRPSAEFEQLVDKIKDQGSEKYDCIVLLSGGKDSSYMVSCLADTGLRVLAFTLDNGFISDAAKRNVEKICQALNVDHVYGRTDSMNAIFKDSLERHSNVCHGCFKTIYTLSLKEAKNRGIKTIFTGLSRGQFFETRLTEELFTNPDFEVAAIDDVVLKARKTYHRIHDAVSENLDTSHLQDGKLLDEVQFVDFYRYCDVNLEEMYEYLENRLPWVRPADTGRSTNCLINDVGIYVHQIERGYHNYALPYSWDVRLGHKQRDEAMDELNDAIEEQRVKDILGEIGYTPEPLETGPSSSIALYYTCKDQRQIEESKVRPELSKYLPQAFLPAHIMCLETMPLNSNGKIDTRALPPPGESLQQNGKEITLPRNQLESELVGLWCRMLGRDRVDTEANFFALGGDSLKAIKMVSEINRTGFNYTVPDLFEHPTVASLAGLDRASQVEKQTFETQPFSQVDAGQMDKLASLLKND